MQRLNLMSFHNAHIPENDLVEKWKGFFFLFYNFQYLSNYSEGQMHRVALKKKTFGVTFDAWSKPEPSFT